jgi:vacuolar-type H+-ATPase subunit I/STV1
MNELQIRLTADIKDLQSALNKAKTSLKSFESESEKDSEKSNVGFRRKIGLIEQLTAKAKELKISLSQATNEQQIAAYNAQLEETNQELTRLNALGKNFANSGVKSFDNLKRSSGAATGSAIAFSRIIQDAPFGIIGVANNIQNFGEQLASLGGKATSTGAKLKLFFSALIQPSSLAILAVSALTAAYQAYS